MQRGASRFGSRNGFLEAGDATAHVDVRRRAAGGGDAKHALDFGDGSTWGVGAAEADGYRALRETVAQDGFDRRQLLFIGAAAAADTGRQQPGARIAKDLHARGNMT